MEYLYILELEGGKYYVGKTTDVKKRFEQHKNGSGAEWTRKYKPKRVLLERPLRDAHDENNVTKDYMQEYGIENVRGGAYTTSVISEEQEDVLRHEIKSTVDTCYKCGKAGHFAKYCSKKSSFKGICQCGREFRVFEEFMSHQKMCIPRRKQECSRCGRDSHSEDKCYATTDVNGDSLDEEEEDEQLWRCTQCDREFKTETAAETHSRNCRPPKNNGRQKTVSQPEVTCYRCNRPGHYSTQCYAYTSSDGDYLGKPKRNYRTDWSDDDSE